MLPIMKSSGSHILGILLLMSCFLRSQAVVRYKFVVEDTTYTRLCNTKKIMTVNGKFPGQTLYVHKGDTIIVDVYNKANYNITLHWHGVTQRRNPWGDGPEYITQCPIKPGQKFSQKVIFSSEEGTLWWHAHSDWSRATVHGAIVVYPQKGTSYPFPRPYDEVPIILGEWWKKDILEVYDQFLKSGRDPNVSDAYLINGQPGDLCPCSKSDTFKLMVDFGKTYLLRMINSGLQDPLFFAVANHRLTIVGTDGSYTKPLKVDYLTISPGQTIDVLLKADQVPDHYYMAAKAYSSAANVLYDNTTATAVLQYSGVYSPSVKTPFPFLPSVNDTKSSVNIIKNLRHLDNDAYKCNVPKVITKKLFFTVSVNSLPCDDGTCERSTRLAASINNISFSAPDTDILRAYSKNIGGVYDGNFPDNPPLFFDFTADKLPAELRVPRKATEVKVLEYNSTVEIVFQGTNLVAGTDHPMHLHGYSFYVVGWGFGNFDRKNDPKKFNLVDPPLQNTITVPKNGWAAIRFLANNPGVWFMHCHLDRHQSWGMQMAFIVKNGKSSDAKMLPQPDDMPPC